LLRRFSGFIAEISRAAIRTISRLNVTSASVCDAAIFSAGAALGFGPRPRLSTIGTNPKPSGVILLVLPPFTRAARVFETLKKTKFLTVISLSVILLREMNKTKSHSLLAAFPAGAIYFSAWRIIFFLLFLLAALPLRSNAAATNSTVVLNSAATNPAAGTNAPPKATAASTNLTDLSLESLMQIEVPTVVSASKYEQKVTDAPSSITVITSVDIKRYGYRTLADLLASVPGFYVTYDRNYSFLGTSGVNQGDFNSRILLLVDGHRINNNLNDGAAIGTDFILDVDLIDRVEVIRGPGSVLYGNNAFFGVINVISRKASDVNGIETSAEYGGFNSFKLRATYGKSFTNGVDLLLSGSYYNSDGQRNLFYKEYNTPAQNNGVAHDLDGDSFASGFATLSYTDFTLEAGYVTRDKANPTAQYLTAFDTPGLDTIDDHGYVDFKYEHSFPGVVDVTARAYYDRDSLDIGYPYGTANTEEKDTGEWFGTELQLNKRIWDKHIITFGAEYRNDFRQDRETFDPNVGTTYSDVHDHRQNYGFYAQGDFELVKSLHLTAGGRYDQYGDFHRSISPRAALIYNPLEQTTFKAIYGTAFRDPNFLELSDPNYTQGINPEKITTYELVYEQGFGKYVRTSLSGYYNHLDNLIVFQDGGFANNNAYAKGIEAAVEGSGPMGIRGRASYSFQDTGNVSQGTSLIDSPKHLFKFNLSVPVFTEKLFAGLEIQYTSQRDTLMLDPANPINAIPGEVAGGFGTVNFTLFSHQLTKNLDLSAGVYNLLNRVYFDPSTRFHEQAVIQQDGRTFRLKATYKF
jgi:outer membrane receptor for ferrienterochelin and colicins